MKQEINGIFVLNKPSGISSNSAVNKVKYLLNAKKAGHLGTLDPLGMGVLPVTLGRATKLFDYYLKKVKTYKTIFKFGEETDTLDNEGTIINKNNVKISKEQIEKIIPLFVGVQEQMPPIYSAKKVNGQKAYDLARKGLEVKLSPKNITIYNIILLDNNEKENIFTFEVTCSSGTYIRSLCRDMAYKMSTYGVMQNIIRTKCGDFQIGNSYTFEDIQNGNYTIIPLEEILENIEKEKINDKN